MNKYYYSLLTTLLFLVSNSNSFANVTPPDSTTSLVDKTAAVYMVEEGKTKYGEGKYKEALIKFRQATVKDPNSWKASMWVGRCHYKLSNYGYALSYAQDAQKINREMDAEGLFFLGQSYHRLGELDSAKVYYENSLAGFSKMRANELHVELLIKECDYAKEQLASEAPYTKERLKGDINSGYDDYGMQLSEGDTTYFISRRSNTTGGGMNPDDEKYFEDTYKVYFDSEAEEWVVSTNKIGKLNSEGFDALNYVSPDGMYAVVTLNNTMTDVKKGTKGSDLCEMKMSNKGTWNSPKIIKNKSINTSYFDASATLSADGSTMIFVSDRKGTKFASDLYIVEKKGKSWGTAKALPTNINTTGNETTPFLTPDGRYLFFSSDGHEGMGGYDVYVCENLGDGSWSTPVNLGAGVNTVNNDTHFVFDPETKSAFVSGYEIIGNKASIDIYSVEMSSFEYPKEQ